MPTLISRAPRPALTDHPAFAFMVTATLERFHCTLGEVREDYWLGRAWRALTGDPVLAGRVARVGVGSVLITGPGYGPAPASGRELASWRLHVLERIVVDTGHSAEGLGMAVGFAEVQLAVEQGCMLSLLAQTVAGDQRWGDLAPYAGDLSPVSVPVSHPAEGIVAA